MLLFVQVGGSPGATGCPTGLAGTRPGMPAHSPASPALTGLYASYSRGNLQEVPGHGPASRPVAAGWPGADRPICRLLPD